MYKLEIKQGGSVISVTDTDIDTLTQFVCEHVDLFGPEVSFTISNVADTKK